MALPNACDMGMYCVFGVLCEVMKTLYEIIIYWSSEDGLFLAEVPELAGCMADGATRSEALAAVEVVIDEWLETAKMLGREIPEPKGKLIYA